MKRASVLSFVPFLLCSVIAGCQTKSDPGVRQTAPPSSAASEPIVSGKTIAATHAVVVSADSIASRVGAEVLMRGGNAVDAAVAVAFALAVTYPRAGNIGGGGFMLVRLASGETHFIDYRETAPLGASRDMFLDSLGNVIEDRSTVGLLAAGVPGTVAGLALAHERFGTLPWSDLVSYAWRLAQDGFPVGDAFVHSIAEERKLLETDSDTKALFVDPAFAPGDLCRQPDLAETLHRLMTEGSRDFYRGRTAELIAAESQRGGGLLTKEDLAGYAAKFREPIRVSYRGYEIISAPLPSSGGIIFAQLFQILGRYDVGALGYHTKEHVHLVVEAEKIAYRLRALYLGDVDFYPAPWKALTEATYIDRLASLISFSHVLAVKELEAADLAPISDSTAASPASGSRPMSRPAESEETTHFSIVDRWGNAVANTYTLNGSFGCGVTVTGAGFLLNNEMDDFSVKPGIPNLYGLVGSEANAIEPGKRMLSSMAPSFVLKDGELFMVAGTPGGSTIPTSILQVISNVVDFHMTLEEAVAAKRFHEQYLPDKISIEEGALPATVVEALRKLGHTVVERENIGDIQSILISRTFLSADGRPRDSRDREGGRLVGASDPRGSGRAIGY
jgi:gamma-glutamyltranspeptidase/glutathione hydrolase